MAYPEACKREEAEIQAAQTMVNINPHVSSSTPYSSHPASYSYPATTAASAPTSTTTVKTSVDSHRSSQSEYDTHPNSAPPRQSLPSIHEALGSRAGDEVSLTQPHSPGPSRQYSRRYSSPSPSRSSRIHAHEPRYGAYGTHRQHVPYESTASHAPNSPRTYGPATTALRPPSPREQFVAPGSRPPPDFSAPSKPSPRATPQYAAPSQSPSFAVPPYVSSSRQLQKGYGVTPVNEFVTSYPTVATSHDGTREPSWRGEDSQHLASSKYDIREPQFPITVKRNLDYYDLDSLLNEVRMAKD